MCLALLGYVWQTNVVLRMRYRASMPQQIFAVSFFGNRCLVQYRIYRKIPLSVSTFHLFNISTFGLWGMFLRFRMEYKRINATKPHISWIDEWRQTIKVWTKLRTVLPKFVYRFSKFSIVFFFWWNFFISFEQGYMCFFTEPTESMQLTQEAQGLGALLAKMEDNDHINWITQRSRSMFHSKPAVFETQVF